MTEDDKTAAAAYIKLHENVKDLILTTVMDELQLNYQSPFSNCVRSHILMSVEAEQRVKSVIRDQFNKY